MIVPLFLVVLSVDASSLKVEHDEFEPSKIVVVYSDLKSCGRSGCGYLDFGRKGQLHYTCFGLNKNKNISDITFNADGNMIDGKRLGNGMTNISNGYSSNCFSLSKENLYSIMNANDLRIRVSHLSSFSVYTLNAKEQFYKLKQALESTSAKPSINTSAESTSNIKSSTAYASVIGKIIQQRWHIENSMYGNSAELKLRLAPDGTVVSVQSCTGHAAICREGANVVNMIGKFPKPPHEYGLISITLDPGK